MTLFHTRSLAIAKKLHEQKIEINKSQQGFGETGILFPIIDKLYKFCRV